MKQHLTFPFNQLSEAEAERLAILAEEAAEVIQCVGKILRHGYESRNPDEPSSLTNRQHLEKEIGDFNSAVNRMTNKDLSAAMIDFASQCKTDSAKKYLHHN